MEAATNDILQQMLPPKSAMKKISVKGILFQKLSWPTVRKNWFSDWELISEVLRPVEEYFRTVKGQNNF